MNHRMDRIRVGIGMLVILACGGLSGCDYWPPALHAEIEQLQVEAQAAAAERAKLAAQVEEATRMRDELLFRVEDMSRANRDLITKVKGLEHALATEKDKANRLAKKAAIAPKAKPTAQPSVKKKTTKKKKDAPSPAKKRRSER